MCNKYSTSSQEKKKSIYIINYGVYKCRPMLMLFLTILSSGSRSLCSSLVVMVMYTWARSRWWSRFPPGKNIKKQWSIFPGESWSLIREG